MKNLLIYTREDGRFSRENIMLAKIQIDNSLSLGWKHEDILLFTNFPYEHNGIKSRIIPNLCYKGDKTNKIPVVVYLLENNLLPDDLIWYHDFDAYQDAPINIETDLAFVGYGYKTEFNCGSFFFRINQLPFFKFWNSKIIPRSRADEKCLSELYEGGEVKFDILNLTYNFGQRIPNLDRTYRKVEQPIRVLHFHPHYRYYKEKELNLSIFMYGKNNLGKPMMSQRLIEIFQKHGVK